MAVMTGRKAMMEIFRQQGVEFIFGNPGTTEMPLIAMLGDYPDMQYILALQEGVALSMAHAYANAAGKPGVINLHVAPGLGNAIGALYNSAIGNIPLVVTAGQQDTRMLVREPMLSYDLVSMARPLVKWSVQIQHTEEIPLIMRRAFKVAQDPPSGPVFVALPSNVLDGEADLSLQPDKAVYRRMAPAADGLAAAAEILARAENPVIICGDGVGVSGAQLEMVHLAEQIGAAVWSPMSIGALNFPFNHPQYRGLLPAEQMVIRRMLGEPDVVLAVGSLLFEEVFFSTEGPFPDGCALVQIDSSPWELGKNQPLTVGILADPKPALEQILPLVKSQMGAPETKAANERRAVMAALKAEEREKQERRTNAKWDSIPISPARLMAELRDCMPDNTAVYNEAITASIDLIRTVQQDQPGTYFGPHAGGIGQGLPGALGVKLARPDQPVVALSGDGSAMYTIQSFYSAAYHQIPVVYVILSNQTYRVLKYNMNRYLRSQSIDLDKPHPFMNLEKPVLDFVSLAKGMGLEGEKVTDPGEIRPALERAFAAGRPYVVEVITEGKVPVP